MTHRVVETSVETRTIESLNVLAQFSRRSRSLSLVQILDWTRRVDGTENSASAHTSRCCLCRTQAPSESGADDRTFYAHFLNVYAKNTGARASGWRQVGDAPAREFWFWRVGGDWFSLDDLERAHNVFARSVWLFRTLSIVQTWETGNSRLELLLFDSRNRALALHRCVGGRL